MRAFRPAQLSLSSTALLLCIAAAPPAGAAVRGTPPAPASAVIAPADVRSSARPHDPGTLPEASTSADAARRAADLHHRAVEAGAAGKWGRAASLHRRAAAQHAADDGRGSRCLELAAQMMYADGDLRGARTALVAVAEQSAARGEVANSAAAYLNAGVLARDLHDPAGAAALTRQAYLLARSPHLTATERAAILDRIVGG